MPAARAAPKRKRSAVASGAPIGAPLSTELMQQEQAADTVKFWTPAAHLIPSKRPDGVPLKYSVDVPYAVLILNQPIQDVELFVTVCHKASYIVAADGGLNRLRDLGLEGVREEKCRPNAVTGDLDSVRDDVLTYYSRRKVHVVKDSDQNTTDFTKSLRLITTSKRTVLEEFNEFNKFRKTYGLTLEPNPGYRPADNIDVFVFGGLGGRADQAFSELHHLYLAHEDKNISVGDIYLVTPESIIFLLHRGTNVIHTPRGPKQLGESIGIIPMGRPSIITTKGLEWDVKDWQTEIGGQISTSNHIRAGKVTVTTTEPVLFTVELAQDLVDQRNHTNGQVQNTVTQDDHINGEPSSKRRRLGAPDYGGDENNKIFINLAAQLDKITKRIEANGMETQANLTELKAEITELAELQRKLNKTIQAYTGARNGSI